MRTYFIFGAVSEQRFMSACMEDEQEVLQLIRAGHDMDATFDGMTALTHAIKNEHDACALLLIENGADIEKAENAATPLIAACEKGNASLAEALLTRGARLNASDKQGSTALMVACKGGHVACVELLLRNEVGGMTAEAGQASRAASLPSTSSDSVTFRIPLFQEPTRHFLNTLLLDSAWGLFRQGAFATYREAVEKMTVEAQQRGRDFRAVFKVRGAFSVVDSHVNLRDNTWKTALMYACEEGHEEIAEFLISCGADVNAFDLEGNTAASFAAKNGYAKIIELLSQKGADVGHRNFQNESIQTLLQKSDVTGRTEGQPSSSMMDTNETGPVEPMPHIL